MSAAAAAAAIPIPASKRPAASAHVEQTAHAPDLRLATLRSLRALLPAPLVVAPGMPTGIDALDRALASGGLPRGRLTEIVGATHGAGGKLTLLRRVVDAAAERGEWVAYVDASRTLAPRDWAHLAHVPGIWIVRPPDASRAAWCADVLLRSAAFSLVVLDSAPPISRAVAVRLTGLARESNAAFVVAAGPDGGDDMLSRRATRLGGAVRLRVQRRRHRLTIAVEKGGGDNEAGGSAGGGTTNRLQHVVEVECAIGVARRLCTHPEVPDRRGAARPASRRPGKGRRAAAPSAPGNGGILQHC